MDRLAAMAVFARVVESGSFSAAARDLGIGQPAVSKSVAALEEHLGVRLLNRTTRGLTPTQAGLGYAAAARRVVDDADEADSLARGEGAGLTGRLRVSAPVTLARLLIVPALEPFLAAHPDLTLDLLLDDRSVDMIAEGVDVAVRVGAALADSSQIARKVGSTTRHVFATPDYLARHGTPREPQDLMAHTAIVYSLAQDAEEWVFNKGTAHASVHVRRRLAVSAMEGVRAAVIAGLGIAMGSRWIFAPELASGKVVPIMNDWTLGGTAAWAVFPPGGRQSAKTRAFVEHIMKTLTSGV